MSPETLIQVIRWRLGLPFSGDVAALRQAWDGLTDHQRWDLAGSVGSELSNLLRQALAARLERKPLPDHLHWANDLAPLFTDWLGQQTVAAPKVASHLNLVAKRFLKVIADPTAAGPPISQERVRVGPPLARPPVAPTVPPSQVTIRPQLPPPTAPRAAPRVTVPPPPPPPPVPMSPTAAWKYIPAPLDVPDPHAEFDAREFDAPAGFKAFGARVRGKKHKHDGTHCDDWFEVTTVNGWTVVAVADGAGSKKFSRVGAKAACERAVADLTIALAVQQFDPRDTLSEWSHAIQTDDANTHAAADVERVADAVRAAMGSAYTAVCEAAAARRNGREYEAVLNRQIEVNDLSCTLLIAVHRVVTLDGKPCSFVAACQVGDGMIGVVHPNSSWRVLGAADSGGYSGETEFITSTGKTDAAALKPKSQVYLGGLQSLLVMTDGVADDYFPPDEQLGRLWADLAVNAIPEFAAVPDDAVAAALAGTNLPTREAVAAADFETVLEVVMEHPRTPVTIRSAAEFAELLGVGLPALLRSGPLLTAGAAIRGPGVVGPTASDRLRLWLDAYHVRGSFDDRTLVAVHRETLPT